MLDPRDVKTNQQAREIVEARNLDHVKVGMFDIDGVMRGKYLSTEKFFSALEKGLAFCDVVLGWDSDDQLYEKVGISYTGWHTAFPDAPLRILPQTCRNLPLEKDMLLFICQFDPPADAICPRSLLQRVLAYAKDLGVSARAAFEYEFFLFDETPDSVREKGYRGLKPFTPGNFGYSILRNSVHSELYGDLLQFAKDMDFPIEGLHTETGPGVLEAAIVVDQAADAADKAALFKTFVKVWAQRRQLMATFMAKWSNEYPGQSGHIHMSLQNLEDGSPVFFDPAQDGGVSERQRHFIGGQQMLMPQLMAMLAQTVNAYSRLIPGFWAPTHATWGVENRTTALRLIPGAPQSQRVEFRLGSADANPYIALAAALGSGLWGIENRIEPGECITGNAYEQPQPDDLLLPLSLEGAAAALLESKVARELFGDAFVEHYAGTRIWETQAYRKHITDWELARYFEII